MLIHIGVFLMAISFAIVSIYLAKLLLRTSGVLKTAGKSATQMEVRIDKMIGEVEETLFAAERTVDDMEVKLDSVSAVFYVARDLSDTGSELTDGVSELAAGYQDKGLKGTKPFVRTIQGAEFVFNLMDSWKRGTKESKIIR